MKRFVAFLTVVCSLCLCSSSFAQNIDSSWTRRAAAGVCTLTHTGDNVGLGLSNPAVKLHINFGNNYNALRLKGYNSQQWDLSITTTGMGLSTKAFYIGDPDGGNIPFVIKKSASNYSIFIDSTGSVGMGTSTPSSSYKLSVNGKIRAKEIKVESGWSDFVFDKNYNLMSLDKLEKYISDNKHLPDVPTAAKVNSEGVNVGEMQARLLQKVEELTLYVIELKKENESLKAGLNNKTN